MEALLILFIVALVISSIGWYKFVYFLSLGYGFSVAACGVAMMVMYHQNTSLLTALLCVILMVYGCRLSGYLLIREIKSASYRKELPQLTKTSKPLTFPVKLSIWISVSILYVMEVSPVLFRLENMSDVSVYGYVGLAIMVVGLVLESLADRQKAAAKKINPKRFCDKGIYKLVRCPNYLGEILFWTGCFVSGIDTYNCTCQWIIAALGYISIVYIMFGGARRLEIRQNKNYGEDSEYKEYVKHTPILIPFIPLYHLEQYRFLKG